MFCSWYQVSQLMFLISCFDTSLFQLFCNMVFKAAAVRCGYRVVTSKPFTKDSTGGSY